MTIAVKGTKSTGISADPAERYAQKMPERLSVIPRVLAMAFVGIGLYLKSIFPALAESRAEGHGDAGDVDPTGALTAEFLATKAAPDKDTDPADPAAEWSDTAAEATLSRPVPVVLAVWLPPDGRHDTPDITLDGLAIMAPADRGGLFKLTGVANDARSPAGMGGIGTSGPVNLIQVDQPPVAQPPVTQPPTADETPDQSGGATNKPKDVALPDVKDRSVPNRAPRVDGPVHLRDVVGASMVLITLADLLRHTVDPDGDPLTVLKVSVSSGQIFAFGADWIYQAPGDYTQPVAITYTVTDGEFEVSQTAHFTAVRPWVQGTDRHDLLIGTQWSDDIDGGAGDDNFYGRHGNDVISGGAGADHILGGTGHDTIFGGHGNDILFGQDGNDHLFGGAGDDLLFGGAGDDLLFGDDGGDTLSGDDGDDLLDGGDGDDRLDGGDGDDLLFGGAGHDVLSDGPGSDTVFGGAGDDVMIAALDAADDWFSGGDGFDTIDYSLTTKGVVINLNQGLATGVEIGTDTLESVEHAIGGAGDDQFIVGMAPSVLTGGAGDNTFEFIAAPVTASPPRITHEITDFKHGDKLKMSHYELFEKVFDRLEDEFEAMYGAEIDKDDIPIQIRHDTVGDVRRTIIEADFDSDSTFETTVYIQGHHVLLIADMTA